MNTFENYASALEGYVIPPIAPNQFVPKHDDDLSRYRPIFPQRTGQRPATTRHEPHQQITQHANVELWDELRERCISLPDVTDGDSLISVPGARGLFLSADAAKGPTEAFVIEREFAHIHPRPDASTHLQLPLELAVVAIGAGWAEPHTTVWLGLSPANTVMLYAPRTTEELDVVWMLVQESYRFACGEPAKFRVEPQLVGEPSTA